MKKIVEEHGGIAVADNEAGGGARVLIRLPVITREELQAEGAGASKA